MAIKLRRITAGQYTSVDGRVLITRHVVQQSRGRGTDEVSWGIIVDGQPLRMDEMTKRDAVYAAERALAKKATAKN